MARLFNGSSDQIIYPNPTRWTTHISAAAWIYVVSLPGTDVTYQIMTDTAGAGLMNYSFRIENEGGTQKIKWAFNPVFATYVTFSITATLSTSAWNHIAWTYDVADTHSIIYVNGVAAAAGTSSSAAGNTTGGHAHIGSRYWGGSTDGYFAGTIGPCALWCDVAVLTQAEVTALANRARPEKIRPVSQLTRCYYLDGIFDPEPDLSSNHAASTTITGTSRANNSPVNPRWS